MFFQSSTGQIPRRFAAKLRDLQSESGIREQIFFHTPSACGGVLDLLFPNRSKLSMEKYWLKRRALQTSTTALLKVMSHHWATQRDLGDIPI
jgi:hypothetical protein